MSRAALLAALALQDERRQPCPLHQLEAGARFRIPGDEVVYTLIDLGIGSVGVDPWGSGRISLGTIVVPELK